MKPHKPYPLGHSAHMYQHPGTAAEKRTHARTSEFSFAGYAGLPFGIDM